MIEREDGIATNPTRIEQYKPNNQEEGIEGRRQSEGVVSCLAEQVSHSVKNRNSKTQNSNLLMVPIVCCIILAGFVRNQYLLKKVFF